MTKLPLPPTSCWRKSVLNRTGSSAGSLIRKRSVRVHPCHRDCSSGKIITGCLPVRLRRRSRDMSRITPSCWWITYSSSRRRNSGEWRRPWVVPEPLAIHLQENARQPQPAIPLHSGRRRVVVRGKIFALFGAERALASGTCPDRLDAKCQVQLLFSQIFFKKGTS